MHENFTFNPLPKFEAPKKLEECYYEEQSLPQQSLFSDEQDPILHLIKKIMYAEGDCVEIRHESALYLKDVLFAFSNYFRVLSK